MAVDDFVLAINSAPERQVMEIDRAKYNVMRSTIVKILYVYGCMSSAQLEQLVENQLQDRFDDCTLWYFNMVKLDLEACDEIRYVSKSQQELIELSNL